MPEEAKKVKFIPLGEEGVASEFVEIPMQRPQSVEDRLTALEEILKALVASMDAVFHKIKDARDNTEKQKDTEIAQAIDERAKEGKAEIPEGTTLWGTSRGLNFFMSVKDGGFYVGAIKYDSPSAAAEAVSGVRRSGWVFWKLPDGRTIKEVFKRGQQATINQVQAAGV
jgi:hypothetical protein